MIYETLIINEAEYANSPDGATFFRCPEHTVKYTIPEGVEKSVKMLLLVA